VSATALSFFIPWSALCSDNRKFLSRHFVLSNQYRTAKSLVGLLARAAANNQRWDRSTDALELDVVITAPDRRYRDLNFSKCLKDGITATDRVWVDDCQVRRESWEFLPQPNKSHPGALVTIRAYAPTNPTEAGHA